MDDYEAARNLPIKPKEKSSTFSCIGDLLASRCVFENKGKEEVPQGNVYVTYFSFLVFISF